MAGPIFETAVLSEVVKTLLGRGEEPHVYFFRTSTGIEVDFIIEVNARLIPIEVKSSATPRPEMATGVAAFRKDFPRRAEAGYLVHTGDILSPLEPGAQQFRSVPYSRLVRTRPEPRRRESSTASAWKLPSSRGGDWSLDICAVMAKNSPP